MNSESIDHLDPLFLASRRLDGDLTEEETSALDAALAAASELRSEAARMAGAQRMVERWSMTIPTFDTTQLSQHVMAAVREEAASRDLADVDAALRGWSQPVEFDERAFSAGVLKKIRAEHAQRRRRLVFRIGAPLAMAAAVAIAVTSALWVAPAPMVSVVFGPQAVPMATTKAVSSTSSSVVMFTRDTAEDRLARRDAPMISLVSVGSDPMAVGEEIPPL